MSGILEKRRGPLAKAAHFRAVKGCSNIRQIVRPYQKGVLAGGNGSGAREPNRGSLPNLATKKC
jgi:hypothetical protein